MNSKLSLWLTFICLCSPVTFVWTDTCVFDMQRIPGLNPLIRTDKNGRSCRGDVLLPFCRGACKTQETGSHIFPYKETNTFICTLIGNKVTNVSLTDCDENADNSVRFVTISASRECACRELRPKP
ncbi:hypothetical protein M3Y94_00116500 [Aphelenchoides besseyi]|nr:hypothetical protein M3Y94_00116500 [Aphelenchoides besseyi]KAI6237452.1 Cys-knot domain-containing protein [Aphelenchoides besseyi]